MNTENYDDECNKAGEAALPDSAAPPAPDPDAGLSAQEVMEKVQVGGERTHDQAKNKHL